MFCFVGTACDELSNENDEKTFACASHCSVANIRMQSVTDAEGAPGNDVQEFGEAFVHMLLISVYHSSQPS